METTEAPAGKTHPIAGLLLGGLTFILASLLLSLAVYAVWVIYFVATAQDPAKAFIKLVIVAPAALLFGYDGPGYIGNPVILGLALAAALAVSLLAGLRVGSIVYRR